MGHQAKVKPVKKTPKKSAGPMKPGMQLPLLKPKPKTR